MTAVLEAVDVGRRFGANRRTATRGVMRRVIHDLAGRAAQVPPLPGERWALRDVSFSLQTGDAIAVLGRNGSGKTTLLRILHGLIRPDAGRVVISGRTEALMALGTGFEPLLTGRENIALSGTAVGLSRRELADATESIVDFAELGHHIDSPVAHYSSGMAARLAFAVAAHMRPDVLLIDEALAVGDFAFQRKCVTHLRRYLVEGGSLILVTHNVFIAQTTCPHALLLDRGQCVSLGPTADVVGRYLLMRERAPNSPDQPEQSKPVRIARAELLGSSTAALCSGAPAELTLTYSADDPAEILWGFMIWTGDHAVCIGGDVDLTPQTIMGTGTLRARLPALPLTGGVYTLRAYFLDAATGLPLATLGYAEGTPAPTVQVEAVPGPRAAIFASADQLVRIPATWS